jgi:hypothetical protein
VAGEGEGVGQILLAGDRPTDSAQPDRAERQRAHQLSAPVCTRQQPAQGPGAEADRVEQRRHEQTGGRGAGGAGQLPGDRREHRHCDPEVVQRKDRGKARYVDRVEAARQPRPGRVHAAAHEHRG